MIINFLDEKPIPPPPPPADFGYIPPPPAPAFDVSQSGIPPPPAPGMGSALLESIKTGTTLKPVEERKINAPVVEDSRGQLLKQIRGGMKLKPVNVSFCLILLFFFLGFFVIFGVCD